MICSTPSSDCRDAIKEGAPRAHATLDSNVLSTFRLAYGDIDGAFADATHVFEEEIWQHRGGGMAIETRAVLANYDAAADHLTVWSGTQTPHIGRRMMADLLGRELESIRMIAPDVGGGFGPKAIFYPEEAVIPAAALKLGRPVKWIEDRREHFLCATQERDQYWDVAIAVDDEGKILGLRGRMLHDSGAFVPWGVIMPYIAAATVPGPYVVPAYQLDTDGGANQQSADNTGARRRPAAGGFHHGAAFGSCRARTWSRPRRGAPAEFHPAGADAL